METQFASQGTAVAIEPTTLPDTPQSQPVQPSTPTPSSSQPDSNQTYTLMPVQESPTNTAQALSSSPEPTRSPTPRPTLAPDEWMSLPVIPTVSETTRKIFAQGQALGRDPHVFSKVGDCQNINTFFLASFENPRLYDLGEYSALQGTIDWYQGSFGYNSPAVKGGMNVAAVLSPLRADPKACQKGENPLACELRGHNPSIALISMEEAWSGDAEKYERYMRQVIEYTISQGIVPIVATKADNLEGGHRINAIIANLAWEYDIPLWNFWAAVQPVPHHGLLEDGFHLSQGNTYHYNVALDEMSGWSMRNLTALQALDAVRVGLLAK